ncbi:hypothetical protein G5B40_08245 [Pikeienuella piscinae]|uniref:VPLPA-CTERM sorting domain-containing protein n=1 Tax=Pikeienuella piscinae TaxID=2748098 RepID=A0A7L5BY52_9RHOB|nr:hypothetical protein [Pikeienuella piscinae]QIE55447.1 hypothetical protein G5B40_08245 [Pikeienuella piscinae]
MAMSDTWLAVAAIAALGFGAPANAASYFVQHSINANGPVSIGTEIDGATRQSMSHTDARGAITTNANLANGTLAGTLSSSGEDAIRGVSSRFGDRVTITGGAGTNVDFNFDFDGGIDMSADSLGNIPILLSGSFRYAIFDPSAGANAGNWTSMSFPIFSGTDRSLGKDIVSFSYRTDALPVSDLFDELLSVTLPVVSDEQSFDIFASLTATLLSGDNAIDLALNLSSVASLGLASGVTIDSASGVFLTEGPNAAPQTVAAVPLPASAPLLLGALGLLAWRRVVSARAA